MIARTWHGDTDASRSAAYLQYLRTVVLPELRAIDGFCGMQVARRDDADGRRFTVTTLWESMAAIGRFAGSSPETAVVPPEARALLSRYDRDVRHAEVVLMEPGWPTPASGA